MSLVLKDMETRSGGGGQRVLASGMELFSSGLPWFSEYVREKGGQLLEPYESLDAHLSVAGLD